MGRRRNSLEKSWKRVTQGGALYTTSPEKERKDPRVCVCVFARTLESFDVIKIAVLLESTYKFKTKPNGFWGELN